jgi:hypothetical protein
MRKPQNILKLSDTPDGRTDGDLIHPLAIVRNIKVGERETVGWGTNHSKGPAIEMRRHLVRGVGG